MAVQSIDRAFQVLKALAVEPSGVTDLASRVGLPKSTVARMLSSLEDQGAVTRGTDGTSYRDRHGSGRAGRRDRRHRRAGHGGPPASDLAFRSAR